MNHTRFHSSKTFHFTFLALIALLMITFIAAHFNLGLVGVTLGLLIASAKAILVALYFMQIRNSDGVHRIAAVVGIFWLGILITFTLSDYLSRNWLMLPSLWQFH